MGDPKRFRSYAKYVMYMLIGFVGSFLILHPYTMIILTVTGRMHGGFSVEGLLAVAKESLSMEMACMAFAFALSCACIGFLTAAVSQRKRRLFEVELENERRRTAIATLQRLMNTLSHYLLNANAVIGGVARRGKKHTAEVKADVKRLPTFSDALAVVRQHLWQPVHFQMLHRKTNMQKRKAVIWERYADALCYAQ